MGRQKLGLVHSALDHKACNRQHWWPMGRLSLLFTLPLYHQLKSEFSSQTRQWFDSLKSLHLLLFPVHVFGYLRHNIRIITHFIIGCVTALHLCLRFQNLDLKRRTLHDSRRLLYLFKLLFHCTHESRTWGGYLLSLGNRVDSCSLWNSKPRDGHGS